MKRPLFLLFLALAAVGCHAQVPTVSHEGIVSWGVPSATSTWTGCTTAAPCSYIVSVLKVASTATSCPASTGSNYTALNASSPATGTSYTDTIDAGSTVCYVAQTQQGVAISSASTPTVNPVTIIGNPLAPALSTPTVAENMPEPSGNIAAPVLVASSR